MIPKDTVVAMSRDVQIAVSPKCEARRNFETSAGCGNKYADESARGVVPKNTAQELTGRRRAADPVQGRGLASALGLPPNNRVVRAKPVF